MTFGLTSAGFVAKRLSDVKSEIEALFKAKFGANVKLDPRSVNGVEIGIISEQIANAWAALEDAYFAAYRDSAAGVSLDRIASLVGVTRDPATKSVVTLTLTGTPSTLIPAGSEVSDAEGISWFTVSDATIGGGGTITADASPANTGPIEGLAGTITEIKSPVSGWAAVTNVEDAAKGADEEKDSSLRLKVWRRRASAGSSKLSGIIGAVAGVAGVTEVQGFENVSVATDSDGRPGKSFEIIVIGGDDDAIAQAIWNAKPAGIEAYGVGSSGSATDGEGATHTVAFSRPADVDVYVALTVTAEDEFPANGDELVAAEALGFADLVQIGRDVTPFGIAQIVETPGIAKLSVALGFTSSPTSTEPLTIGPRERADIDSSRITVEVAR